MFRTMTISLSLYLESHTLYHILLYFIFYPSCQVISIENCVTFMIFFNISLFLHIIRFYFHYNFFFPWHSICIYFIFMFVAFTKTMRKTTDKHCETCKVSVTVLSLCKHVDSLEVKSNDKKGCMVSMCAIQLNLFLSNWIIIIFNWKTKINSRKKIFSVHPITINPMHPMINMKTHLQQKYGKIYILFIFFFS